MTRARVRAHQRKDGSRVRAHDRQTPQPGERRNVDPDAAAAAASGSDAGSDAEAFRPVGVQEAATILKDLGCGRTARHAPLVHVARDETGLRLTVALEGAHREGSGRHRQWNPSVPYDQPAAAIEVWDPTAGGDPADSLLNGRHLLDVLKTPGSGTTDPSATLDDLRIGSNGTVSLGTEAAAPVADGDHDVRLLQSGWARRMLKDTYANGTDSTGIPAEAFAGEIDAVASAASTDSSRPVLKCINFGTVNGQPSMTATDSYRLHSTRAFVPEELCAGDGVMVHAAEVRSWAKAVTSHLAESDSAAELRTARHHELNAGRSVRLQGFQAGQMRAAMRCPDSSPFPQFEPLLRPQLATRRVDVSAEALAKAARSKRRRPAKGQTTLFEFEVSSEDGNSEWLHWRFVDGDRVPRSFSEYRLDSASRTGPLGSIYVDRSDSAPQAGDGDTYRLTRTAAMNAIQFCVRDNPTTLALHNIATAVRPVKITNSDNEDRLALIMPVRIADN